MNEKVQKCFLPSYLVLILNIDRTRKFFLKEKFNLRAPQPSWNLTEQWADENITPEILQHVNGKYW